MSVVKAYTTEAKLETFLGKDITAGQADDAINGAVSIIDLFTGRNFIADTTASERAYDGNDTDLMDIDDCIDVTEVKVGQDEWGDSKVTVSAGGTSGYYELPNNYAAKGYPINQLKLRARTWIRGLANHIVKGKWGYSAAVPADVTMAANVLAAGIYNYRFGGSGNIRSESIGAYSVSYGSEAEWQDYARAIKILDGYKKNWI